MDNYDSFHMTGKEWQLLASQLLKQRLGEGAHFQEIPDFSGDGGVDFFHYRGDVADIYQCYAAHAPYHGQDLYEKQRDKITEDIGKIITNSPTIIKMVGEGKKIDRWILFVPYCADRRIITHAATKTAELKGFKHVAPDFRIMVEWLGQYALEREELKKKGKLGGGVRFFAPWGRAVWDSPLWPENSTLRMVVAAWAEQQHDALYLLDGDGEAHPNPWRDEGWPLRALKRLEQLSAPLSLDPPWSDAEAALLVMAPFLRHAILAKAEDVAPDARWPNSPSELTHDAEHPLQLLHEAHARLLTRRPQLERKRDRLQERQRLEEAVWVNRWVLHHALLPLPLMWDATTKGTGALSPELTKSVWAVMTDLDPHGHLFPPDGGKESPFLLARRMPALDERFLSRIEGTAYLNERPVRLQLMAHLADLAGRMALDPRLLPEVMVDHVGLQDPITPEGVRTALGRVQWVLENEREWGLRLECDHPALDCALREWVERMEQHRLQGIERNIPQARAIPSFSARLEPIARNSQPTYTIPHLRFTLAQEEVRELLMGEQLYGDPALAIREMYQNALDACRHREVRLLAALYRDPAWQAKGWIATHEGRTPGRGAESIDAGEMPNEAEKKAIAKLFHWRGEIVFRQGVDDRGPYILCEDNGIGMGMRELRDCFARAGSRFVHAEEYVEESFAWRRQGIRHYPNSQFGIGVFSYFMLADEIDVHSRRCGPPDKPRTLADPVAVSISGSGSLFRVRPSDADAPCPDGGTRVRLTLNRTMKKNKRGYGLEPISVLNTLKEWLWIAEFAVHVEDEKYEVQATWTPGVLTEQKDLQRVPTGIPDLWWSDKGRLLADGLWTEAGHECLVVNLRGRRRPALTVDRKKVVNWEGDWIRETLDKEGWKALHEATLLGLEFFWKACQAFPWAVDLWWQDLRRLNKDVELSIRNEEESLPVQHPLRFGICPVDGRFFQLIQMEDRKFFESGISSFPSHYLGVRAPAVFGGWEPYETVRGEIGRHMGRKHWTPPDCAHESLITLAPLTAWILSRNLDGREPWLEDAVPALHILIAARKLQQSPGDLLARFAPLGLKLPEATTPEVVPMPQERDLILLSRNLDGREPWLEDTVPAAHILRAAQKLQQSPGDLLAQLQRFAPLGLKLPEATTPEAVPMPQKRDLILLSKGMDEWSWLEDAVPAVRILCAAQEFQQSPGDLLARLQPFAPLGLKLPEVTTLEGVPMLQETDLILLSRDLSGKRPWLEDAVSALHILRAAQKLQQSPRDLLAQLQRFAPLGLKLPEATNREAVPMLQERDLILLSRFLNGGWPWLEDAVPAGHILSAARMLQQSPRDLLARLQRFAPLGLKPPEADDPAFQGISLDEVPKRSR